MSPSAVTANRLKVAHRSLFMCGRSQAHQKRIHNNHVDNKKNQGNGNVFSDLGSP